MNAALLLGIVLSGIILCAYIVKTLQFTLKSKLEIVANEARAELLANIKFSQEGNFCVSDNLIEKVSNFDLPAPGYNFQEELERLTGSSDKSKRGLSPDF